MEETQAESSQAINALNSQLRKQAEQVAQLELDVQFVIQERNVLESQLAQMGEKLELA